MLKKHKAKRASALPIYTLDEQGHPVVEGDVLRWSEWYQRAQNRVLKQDRVSPRVRVSTIFLGIDRNFILRERGRPILWETMVFGGRHDGYCQRYATREEALAGHAGAVKLAKGKKIDE
jgi:hypothetical protein